MPPTMKYDYHKSTNSLGSRDGGGHRRRNIRPPVANMNNINDIGPETALLVLNRIHYGLLAPHKKSMKHTDRRNENHRNTENLHLPISEEYVSSDYPKTSSVLPEFNPTLQLKNSSTCVDSNSEYSNNSASSSVSLPFITTPGRYKNSAHTTTTGMSKRTTNNDNLFDLVSRLQSYRLDDQRCVLPPQSSDKKVVKNGGGVNENGNDANHHKISSNSPHQIIDQICETDKLQKYLKILLDTGLKPHPTIILPDNGKFWCEPATNYSPEFSHMILKNNNRKLLEIEATENDMHTSACFEMDDSARTYRAHFLGYEHINFFGEDIIMGPVIISMKTYSDSQGTSNKLKSNVNSEKFHSFHGIHQNHKSTDYVNHTRMIIRYKLGSVHKLFTEDYDDQINISTSPLKLAKAVVPELTLNTLYPVVFPGASDLIVNYDEHILDNNFKFGLIYQKQGQISEESILANRSHSEAMETFMNIIGKQIDLCDHFGYKGGLDTEHGQTGEKSLYEVFHEKEIMFHVSTLLPYIPNDVQQLQKKRHIGNDIVVLVFQDENTPFSPLMLRSHFVHAFVVVQPLETPTFDDSLNEGRHSSVKYKVNVVARDDVPYFGPTINPTGIVQTSPLQFKEFLLTKLINCQNACLRSNDFAKLENRTRLSLLGELKCNLESYTETYLRGVRHQNQQISAPTNDETDCSFDDSHIDLDISSASLMSLPTQILKKKVKQVWLKSLKNRHNNHEVNSYPRSSSQLLPSPISSNGSGKTFEKPNKRQISKKMPVTMDGYQQSLVSDLPIKHTNTNTPHKDNIEASSQFKLNNDKKEKHALPGCSSSNSNTYNYRGNKSLISTDSGRDSVGAESSNTDDDDRMRQSSDGISSTISSHDISSQTSTSSPISSPDLTAGPRLNKNNMEKLTHDFDIYSDRNFRVSPILTYQQSSDNRNVDNVPHTELKHHQVAGKSLNHYHTSSDVDISENKGDLPGIVKIRKNVSSTFITQPRSEESPTAVSGAVKCSIISSEHESCQDERSSIHGVYVTTVDVTPTSNEAPNPDIINTGEQIKRLQISENELRSNLMAASREIHRLRTSLNETNDKLVAARSLV